MRGSRTPSGVPSEDSVYPPREDTELLLPFARSARGLRLLEIGCGNGALALEAARQGARVVATDLNPWALRSLLRRARSEGLALDAIRTDLAGGLRTFDRILANPPYLPTPPAARDTDPWVNLALDGGPDGTTTTGRILQDLSHHLAKDGTAYLVVSSRQAVARLAALALAWESAGGQRRVGASLRIGDEELSVWELTIVRPDRQGSAQPASDA